MNNRLHEIIFEADTKAGKIFDILLIISVLLSVAAVMLESVGSIEKQAGGFLRGAEWFFTILFTVEYILRLIAVKKPFAYARSFYGIVDLMAILPTYIGIFIPATRFLRIIRLLRVLRLFRVLKLAQYVREMNTLIAVLKASRRRIFVFLTTVLTLVVLLGSLMYVIEGGRNGFTSIPRSVYWAIVTLTTVGYGDISPKTEIGQAVAAAIMILGYSMIIIPTGLISVAAAAEPKEMITTQSCPSCCREGHDRDAEHCKFCGSKLNS